MTDQLDRIEQALAHIAGERVGLAVTLQAIGESIEAIAEHLEMITELLGSEDGDHGLRTLDGETFGGERDQDEPL